MDEILHHFETMTNPCLLVFTGGSSFQGSGGAGLITCLRIHNPTSYQTNLHQRQFNNEIAANCSETCCNREEYCPGWPGWINWFGLASCDSGLKWPGAKRHRLFFSLDELGGLTQNGKKSSKTMNARFFSKGNPTMTCCIRFGKSQLFQPPKDPFPNSHQDSVFSLGSWATIWLWF